MSDRGDEFMKSIGNDSPGHEFYDDVDFEQVGFVPADEYDKPALKYPIVTRYIKPEDDLQKLNDTINGGEKKIATIGEEAQAYEPPQQTKNIADLEKVSVDLQLIDDKYTFTNKKTGEEETVDQKVIEIDGINYKVPLSVLNQVKAQMEANPSMKFFKVKKEGEELNTRYTVIPLTE